MALQVTGTIEEAFWRIVPGLGANKINELLAKIAQDGYEAKDSVRGLTVAF